MKPKRTCKITNGANFLKKREGRPDYNRYYPSRKRTRRKARRTAITTS